MTCEEERTQSLPQFLIADMAVGVLLTHCQPLWLCLAVHCCLLQTCLQIPDNSLAPAGLTLWESPMWLYFFQYSSISPYLSWLLSRHYCFSVWKTTGWEFLLSKQRCFCYFSHPEHCILRRPCGICGMLNFSSSLYTFTVSFQLRKVHQDRVMDCEVAPSF